MRLQFKAEPKFRSKSLFVLSLAVVLISAGCSDAGDTSTTAQSTKPADKSTSTTVSTPVSTSTTLEAPPISVSVVKDLVYRDAGDSVTGQSLVDVYAPEGASGLPAVVLLHGYTRPGHTTELFPLAPLAEEIAQLGAVVFFFKWETTGQYSSASAHDLGCIGSYVEAHAASYGARSDQVLVIGHSMGAEVGANLAFRSFDLPTDSTCVEAGARPSVEAFVGIAGDYSSLGIPDDTDQQLFRYPSGCFDGPAELPATDSFKPGLTARQAFDLGGYSSMSLAPRGLLVMVVAGTEDVDFCAIPDIARDFAEALGASGLDVEHVEIQGAGHSDIIEPDTAAGQETLKLIQSILANLQRP